MGPRDEVMGKTCIVPRPGDTVDEFYLLWDTSSREVVGTDHGYDQALARSGKYAKMHPGRLFVILHSVQCVVGEVDVQRFVPKHVTPF
jgi:hypothetical protein